MRGVLAAALRRLANRLMPQPCVHQVTVQLDAETVIRAIKMRNRRKGFGSAGI